MNAIAHPLALLTLALAGCAAGEAAPKDDAAEAHAGHGHGHAVVEPKDEVAPTLGIPLDPKGGSAIGLVFESYLSPHQEADEETDVPDLAPDAFRSTKTPSVPREQRPGRGHGVLGFSKDFSKAYVELALDGIDPQEIVMAHIHCGKPGMLGPIIVDFGKTGSVAEYFSDGVLTYEVTNRDLELVLEGASGVVGAFTAGCPINSVRPDDRVRTLAGMAVVANEGDLYFNIHTASQTFYGDVRGQLLPRTPWEALDAPPDARERQRATR